MVGGRLQDFYGESRRRPSPSPGPSAGAARRRSVSGCWAGTWLCSVGSRKAWRPSAPAVAIAEDLGGAEGIALGASNLATLLDRVGRTAEALDVAPLRVERVRVLGVERTYGGAISCSIAAKAAIALGRWDDADGFLRLGLARRPVGTAGIRLRIQRGRLDTFRGDLASAGGRTRGG